MNKLCSVLYSTIAQVTGHAVVMNTSLRPQHDLILGYLVRNELKVNCDFGHKLTNIGRKWSTLYELKSLIDHSFSIQYGGLNM